MRIKVEDVMTVDVAAVKTDTRLQTIAEMLVSRGISGVPVVDEQCHVLGVVSEADLMRREAYRQSYDNLPVTAAELMSRPARTVRNDASVQTAARLLARYDVKRLPVVDEDGYLCGIVSRRDVLRVYLRSDADIAQRVERDVLRPALGKEPDAVRLHVRDGVVTLEGSVPRRGHVTALVSLIENLDGVVGVVNLLTPGKVTVS